MQLTEINKDKTPHLFYSGLDTDGAWLETQAFDYVGGLKLRKRCVAGWQDLDLAYGVMKLYFVPEITVINPDDTESIIPDETGSVLIADGFLRPQKMDWDLDDWVDMAFAAEQLSVALASGDYDAHSVYDNGTDRVEIDIVWRIGNSKQRYRVSSNIGERVRLAAAVTDYQVDGIDLKQSIEDFMGFALTQVYDNPDGTKTTLYVFESDGQEITSDQPVFEVDPYISLDEVTSTISVYIDGLTLEFTQLYFLRLRTSTGFDLSGAMGNGIQFGGVTYYARYDGYMTRTVLLNTPTKVQIRVDGNWSNVYGANLDYLPGSDGFSFLFTIYPDRFACEYTQVNSSDIVITNSSFYQLLAGNGTNIGRVYENNGVESVAANYSYHDQSVDYVAVLTDQLNLAATITKEDVTGVTIRKYNTGSSGWNLIFLAGTLAAGTHVVCWEIVVDSAERIGGKKYTSTERLAQGIQYTDPDDLTFTSGSAVTSGTGVTSIGLDGFASDGAYHISGSDISFTLDDNDQYNPALVIHDFPVQSGDPASPTDYSLAHFKLDQAYNTTQIRDEVTGLNVGSGADTIDFISIDNRQTVHADSTTKRLPIPAETYIGGTKFTISCDYKHIRRDSDGYARPFHYSDTATGASLRFDPYFWGNCRLFFYAGWVTSSVLLSAPAPKDGVWNHLDVFVDMEKGCIGFALNGKMKALAYDTTNIIDWGVLSSNYSLNIAYVQTGTSSIYVDNFKIFNDVLFPYGAYFTGNGAVNAALAHKDILFYLACADNTCTTADIGTTGALSIQSAVTVDPNNGPGGLNCFDLSSVTSIADAPIKITDITDFALDKGSILFWVSPKYSGQPTVEQSLIYNPNFTMSHIPSGNITTSYTMNGGVSAAWSPVANQWYCFELRYDAIGNYLELFIDGISYGIDTALSDAPSLSQFNFGRAWRDGAYHNYRISQIYITNNPDTPKIPTVNGVPLHVPVRGDA